MSNLQKIAGRRLVDLVSESGNELWLFPKDKTQYGDRIEKETIFTLEGNMLSTGNIMGFIGCGDTDLTIHSRFSTSYETDFFMQYLLQKVLSINIFDLKHSHSDDNALDIAYLLFPYFLQKALRQGLYREYRRIEYNNDRVKGSIDFNSHIKENFPFLDGRVAYSTREFRYDNSITQLIRHTIEHIKTRNYSFVLFGDKEIRDYVQVIVDSTPSYRKSDLAKVMSQNIRPVSHPYYSEYRPLQKLCLQILRRERISYSNNAERIRGVLFDGAWLWEEYLGHIMKSAGFKHPKNKEREGGLNIYVNRARGKIFPDFLHPCIVADAKYKRYFRNADDARDFGIPQEDLFQMISYIHLTNKNIGVFICPRDRYEVVYDDNGEIVPNWNSLSHSIRFLKGLGGEIHVISLNIPNDCPDYDSFCYRMQGIESSLVKNLQDIIAYSTSPEATLLSELGL